MRPPSVPAVGAAVSSVLAPLGLVSRSVTLPATGREVVPSRSRPRPSSLRSSSSVLVSVRFVRPLVSIIIVCPVGSFHTRAHTQGKLLGLSGQSPNECVRLGAIHCQYAYSGDTGQVGLFPVSVAGRRGLTAQPSPLSMTGRFQYSVRVTSLVEMRPTASKRFLGSVLSVDASDSAVAVRAPPRRVRGPDRIRAAPCTDARYHGRLPRVIRAGRRGSGGIGRDASDRP